MYTIDEIKTIINPILKKENIVKAILFGSYAKGIADSKSDVDTLIDGGGLLTGFDFFNILGNIEDLLDKNIDDFEQQEIIHGGAIEREINDTGVVIYEQNQE